MKTLLFSKRSAGRSLVFFVSAMLLMTGVAHAKKSCTDQPKSKWMSVEDFKKKVEAEGYKIRKFKQPGTCYEIYGTDKNGADVEIYFNPVDGSIVRRFK